MLVTNSERVTQQYQSPYKITCVTVVARGQWLICSSDMSQGKSASRGWVTANVRLTGKTVLITGGSSGIGLETAIDLARRDARILIACRDRRKADIARNRIVQESGSQNVIVKELDLGSLHSVRQLAEDVTQTEDRLDVLINNAGIFQADYCETTDGFETHFGVNHLGHFLLTTLLMDMLKKSAPSRIIHVSSSGHSVTPIRWDDINKQKHFNPTEAYCQSKLMNLLFSSELSRRLRGTGVTSNGLHPGVVRTGIDRETQGCCKLPGYLGCIVCCISRMKCLMRSVEHGAQTSIYCAIAPELEDITGKYFVDCKIKPESRLARDEESAKRLWELSNKLTQMTSQPVDM